MLLKAKDIDPKSRKVVGKWGDTPIMQMMAHGGLYIVTAVKNGGTLDILGAGPHQGVARFIAQKKTKKGIQFNDLRKSDHVPECYFMDLVPRYEAYTDALRERYAERQG